MSVNSGPLTFYILKSYFYPQDVQNPNTLCFLGFNFIPFKYNPMTFWISIPSSQPENKGIYIYSQQSQMR